MGQNNKPPHPSRAKAQMRLLGAGTAPASMTKVAGFNFTDGNAAPDNMRQYSSATYSLGSPVLNNMPQFAVMSYSLGSTAIPANVVRVAILPEQ